MYNQTPALEWKKKWTFLLQHSGRVKLAFGPGTILANAAALTEKGKIVDRNLEIFLVYYITVFFFFFYCITIFFFWPLNFVIACCIAGWFWGEHGYRQTKGFMSLFCKHCMKLNTFLLPAFKYLIVHFINLYLRYV